LARRLGLVIGDVSGKGIPAALFMAMTVTRIRTIASEGGSAAHCLTEVNRVLVREKASSLFATCFYGILDLVSGRLEYCRAGHNPPYLVRADGAVETLNAASGLPLGMFKKVNYNTATVQLAAGDTLLLFTDGITEAMNPRLEEYGEERLVQLLGTRATALEAEALVELVTREAAAFAEGAPASDDLTVLGVRYLCR
jgi:phosphoserine phosphatase RsbU/P